MLQTSLLLMKGLNKTEIPIFFKVCSLFPTFFYVYFTTLQLVLVMCGGGRSLPVLYHSTGIIGPIVVYLKMGVLLMHTLGGVSSVANFITTYEESQ